MLQVIDKERNFSAMTQHTLSFGGRAEMDELQQHDSKTQKSGR